MNFATGDTKGYIYEKDGAICRVHTGTDCTYPQKIFSLYRQHDLKRFGVIETTLQQDGTFLHPLLPLTYPHEWCPSMFKDAVLFHLDLLLILAKVGLTLKDALPENILFLHGRPILVDFFSLFPRRISKRNHVCRRMTSAIVYWIACLYPICWHRSFCTRAATLKQGGGSSQKISATIPKQN